MLPRSTVPLFLAAASSALAGETPRYPCDPASTQYCTWWMDRTPTTNLTCAETALHYSLDMEDLLRWNPSLPDNCTRVPSEHSWCVQAKNEPKPGQVQTMTSISSALQVCFGNITSSGTSSSGGSSISTTTAPVTTSSTSGANRRAFPGIWA